MPSLIRLLINTVAALQRVSFIRVDAHTDQSSRSCTWRSIPCIESYISVTAARRGTVSHCTSSPHKSGTTNCTFAINLHQQSAHMHLCIARMRKTTRTPASHLHACQYLRPARRQGLEHVVAEVLEQFDALRDVRQGRVRGGHPRHLPPQLRVPPPAQLHHGGHVLRNAETFSTQLLSATMSVIPRFVR